MILEGLTVPVITPLNEDESLDEGSLRRVIDLSIEGGAQAIFILGTAGEFAALSSQTKDRLAHASKEIIDRRVDFLIGISHAGTRGTIEEGKRMEKVGADAFVVMAPFYFSYSQKEVESHFLTIAHALSTPLVMYNFPGMVTNSIEPETVARLVRDSQIVGIKNTHDDMDAAEQILSIKKANPGSFSFSQGDLSICGECLRQGADGVTLGIASLIPSLCAQLCKVASTGDAEAVDLIVQQLVQLAAVGHSKSWVAGLKMQASLLGLCKPFVSAPLEMPDEADTRILRQKLLELNLL